MAQSDKGEIPSKKKRVCSYDSAWEKEYPILPSNNNRQAFYCIPCKKAVSCAHMGKGDVQRHCDPTSKSIHNNNLKAIKSSSKIQFSKESAPNLSVLKAELLHVNPIVQHNLPFSLADHLSKMYPAMFPDSQIAKRFACARTKTTQILNGAMMPELKSYIVSQMKAEPYSLVNDGTSDTGLKKMNAACALIFDTKKSKEVEFKFYNMCSTTGEHASTAETLFQSIQTAMNNDGISWSKCISFGVDNCNSNVGEKNSIKTRILSENKSCFIAGCSCHLAHLAAGKGGKAYTNITSFDVEDHQVDLYYYFKGSTRRKGILSEFVDFVGLEWEDMSRFAKTRWLCLEKCCDKELRKYPAFKSMFESRTGESSKQDRGDETGNQIKSKFERLKKAFADPLTEVHISFFTAVLPLFTHFNSFFQRSDPQAHNVYPMTKGLARKIASRFLQPECLDNVSLEILENKDNFLPLTETHVGFSTMMTLRRLYEEGLISKHDKFKQLEAAQAFYQSSLEYVLKKMAFKDEFWIHAVWINFSNRKSAKWDSVNYFLTKYCDLLNMNERKYDHLYEEFQDFKLLNDDELDLSDAILTTYDDGSIEYRMDTIWYILQEIKSPVGNNYRFRTLFEIAKLVLITPHSNAGIERVYSLVNKNKREGSERNRLDIDGSLSSILAVKLDRPESTLKCFNYKPNEALMLKSKKATKEYNDAQCSK